MMRYILLNGIVLLAVVVIFCWQKKYSRDTFTNNALHSTLVVSILTAIFDPLIIAAGIVAYNREFTLRVNVFQAPIEDFAYALAAGLLIPLLWRSYEKKA